MTPMANMRNSKTFMKSQNSLTMFSIIAGPLEHPVSNYYLQNNFEAGSCLAFAGWCTAYEYFKPSTFGFSYYDYIFPPVNKFCLGEPILKCCRRVTWRISSDVVELQVVVILPSMTQLQSIAKVSITSQLHNFPRQPSIWSYLYCRFMPSSMWKWMSRLPLWLLTSGFLLVTTFFMTWLSAMGLLILVKVAPLTIARQSDRILG